MLGDPLHSLTFREIELLAALESHASIRALARTHGVSAAAVSRSISGLERRLSTQLLQRGAHGVLLTERGRKLARIGDELMRTARRLLEAARTHEGEGFVAYLGVGFTSGLSNVFAGALTAAVETISTGTGCRLIESTIEAFAESVRTGALDLVVSFDGIELGKQWTSLVLGKCTWVLCARPGHPVLVGPEAEFSAAYPLVHLARWPATSGATDVIHEWVAGFPIGSEVPDATTAIALAETTNELACVPEIYARASLRSGRLFAVPSAQPEFTSELFLHANADQVPQKVFRAVANALSQI